MSQRRLNTACLLGAFIACGSIAYAGSASAQNVSAQGTSESRLEEILVTAQRREEDAQRVPITVDTYSEKQLSDLQITSTLQLMDFTPGLNITRANAAAVPFLRGVGNFSASLGIEATVATFVDEVYRPGVGASIFSFNNVQQVAVLYGPQGTLFGRNAAGGVISVITKDPTADAKADAQIGYANYNTVTGSFYVTGAIANNVAADLAVDLANQGTGWGKNLYDGTDAYLSNEVSLRSKWLFTPTESDRITVIGYFDKLRNDQAWTANLYPGTVSLTGHTHAGGFYDVDTNIDAHGINVNDGASVKVDHRFQSFDLISISAYGGSSWYGGIENDASPTNLQESQLDSQERTYQEELRLVSSPGSKIVWTGGLYVFIDSAYTDPNLKLGTSVGAANYPGLVQYVWADQDTDSYAGFGQATIPINDTTHVTVGGRYTTDKRRFHGENLNDLGEVKAQSDGTEKATNSSPTYRLSLDHNFTDAILGYVSYNRGFKSGAFNTGGVTAPPTQPETVDAYEAGFKSDLLNNNLRINSAVFLNKFQDLQVLQQTILGPIQTNAGSAKYKGVDFSAMASPLDNLTLTLAAEYLDAYYVSYSDALFYFPAPSGLGMVSKVADASGYTIPFAEKFSASLSGRYVMNTNSGAYALATGAAYHDGFFFDTQGLTRQPEYWMVNSSVTWTSLSKSWDVQLWGDNLLNEKIYAQRQVQAVGFTYSAAAPATYGVKFGYHWK
jgi:iron complex outermembrane recepter protein